MTRRPDRAAGQQFFNTSPLTFTKLLDDPNTIADSLRLFIGGFSEAAKDVIDKFDFGVQIDRLRRANVLYQVIGKFAEIDLHPEAVSNIEMGYLYEELIRRFSERVRDVAQTSPRKVVPGRGAEMFPGTSRSPNCAKREEHASGSARSSTRSRLRGRPFHRFCEATSRRAPSAQTSERRPHGQFRPQRRKSRPPDRAR